MKGVVLLLLVLFFGINSCKKSNSKEANDKDGPARVIVNMLGVDETSEPLVATNSSGDGKLAVNAKSVQQSIVPFSKDISIVATLVPAGPLAGSETKDELRVNSTKLATNATTPTVLTAMVKYRVIVYDADGFYVTSKDYAYGNEATIGGIALDAGKTYTFVAYSVNSSTTTIPDVTPILSSTANLSTSTLTGVTGDLMYFSKPVTLTFGDNNLDIILKHEFSQITTNITLDPSLPGPITDIRTGSITSKASASMNLGTGAITSYTGTASNNVMFPGT